MTPQDAIEALKLINLKASHPFLSWEEMLEVRDFALEALEKQIPKKPIGDLHSVPHHRCPICNSAIRLFDNEGYDAFCKFCGQAIDWSEEE